VSQEMWADRALEGPDPITPDVIRTHERGPSSILLRDPLVGELTDGRGGRSKDLRPSLRRRAMQIRHTGSKAINELLDRVASPHGYQHKLRTSILLLGAGGHVYPA